ncbi:hypothetical protein NP493_158g00001 [Ridgeia piscesae]|uniref:Ion transport domain-containing protein n=1 Tax=Ridgeia piscesae TaxID=27915 RepID=A0AAD9P3U3_RIDPI|nr:hypothetical protein NP493_158g00001 [Ridgeia piscesae]
MYPALPKMIFVIYMIMVALLLINMLIAMMGNTYQLVNETQKEWLRQWAKIILVVEQTVTTAERAQEQIKYSEEMKDGRRALTKEKEELQQLRKINKMKRQSLMNRKQDTRAVHNKHTVIVEEAKYGHINI